MSTKIRLFSKLLLILLLSFQFTHAMADAGKVFNVKGTAVINGSELRSGDTVDEGDIIKTANNSSVQIIMKDRTVLDLNENTRFQVSKYSYNKDKPAKNKSSFTLLKGAFRYISGLIAKNRPQNVQISAGTATIGIRGSFDTISFDGTTITVNTSIGKATITLPDGSTVTVTKGQTGTINVSTGASSVNPTTTQDPVAVAAAAIAENPNDPAAVKAALSNLSDADAIVAIAVLMNNAANYGIDSAALVSIVGNATAANPKLATALAFVSSALDPENSDSYKNTILENKPDDSTDDADDTSAVRDASSSGKALGGGGGGGGTGASPS